MPKKLPPKPGATAAETILRALYGKEAARTPLPSISGGAATSKAAPVSSSGADALRHVATKQWVDAYGRGVLDTLDALIENPSLLERAKFKIAMQKQVGMANALRQASASESPAVKSARKRRLKRLLRDEGQAIEFGALIRAGETTESARTKLGVGAVKAKRLRAIAVRLQLIRPRQRKP